MGRSRKLTWKEYETPDPRELAGLFSSAQHPVMRENRPHVLLLNGTPGVGKTTVIHKGLCGFYTEEIREKGERRGFRLVSFEGRRKPSAS